MKGTEPQKELNEAGAGNDPALAPAARRALAEAAERRQKMDARAKPPRELHGRKGLDPVRYGDWEKDGIISDF